ncbi:MFS transporter [Paenibacillus agricola]|uniref:Multidrug efflux MFS transporter n=1 Tax=Paenibacillus agricola TaxID=2716264 RepID=A0ABX0JKX5_9BACL|nr:MFS transporter [Paenibacillus agricola]NHN34766.1 multidrug efflux MFS transporter [Paenibacillus agricola]
MCSLAAGIWFAIHIRAHAYPFLQTTLFKNPLYRIGVIIGFLMFSAIMTMMFLLPLMLFQLYALSADTIGSIGSVMFPGAICAALCGKIARNIVVKKGTRYVTFTGLGLIALGFALIWISIDQWVWWIAAALVVMNMGYAFSQTSITESVSSTLRGNQIGISMGLFSLGMFIAQALGTAMAAKLLDVSFLAFPLHSFVMEKQSLVYVNLTLLMILVILCSSFMYFLFSRRASQTSNLGAESHGN